MNVHANKDVDILYNFFVHTIRLIPHVYVRHVVILFWDNTHSIAIKNQYQLWSVSLPLTQETAKSNNFDKLNIIKCRDHDNNSEVFIL